MRVTQTSIPGIGPRDPQLRVFDGHSLFAVRLADIALVRRADPEGEGIPEPVPPTGTATADCGPPAAEDLSLLIEQYLHLAGHRFGQNWQAVDQTAYDTSRQLLTALEDAHRGQILTTFTMSVNLFDTWHECPSGRARMTPDIGVTGRPYKVEFSFVEHDPQCCDAPYACEIADELPALITVLALFGGTVEARPSMPLDRPAGAGLVMPEIYWQVENWQAEEVCRRLWRSDDAAPGGGVVEIDTNPSYLPPWMIAEGWTVPEGGSALKDAVPPPGWEPKSATIRRAAESSSAEE